MGVTFLFIKLISLAHQSSDILMVQMFATLKTTHGPEYVQARCGSDPILELGHTQGFVLGKMSGNSNKNEKMMKMRT